MSQVEIAVVIGAAFVPALALLLLIQQAERRGHREGLGMLGATFLYGAVFAVVFALVLNPLATGVLSRFLPALDARFVAIVVAAPLVEEAVKAYGVNLARSRIRRSVDGAVYGAACGLGFGATENLAYQLQALVEGGTFGWLLTVLARSLSSILVHPAATGVTGYGMARARLGGRGAWAVLPYYAFAVVLHALFNYIAAFLAPFAVGEVVLSLNFLFAVLLAVGAFRVLRGAIARA